MECSGDEAKVTNGGRKGGLRRDPKKRARTMCGRKGRRRKDSDSGICRRRPRLPSFRAERLGGAGRVTLKVTLSSLRHESGAERELNSKDERTTETEHAKEGEREREEDIKRRNGRPSVAPAD